jgi:NADH-quinone oxidoreductase subunit J
MTALATIVTPLLALVQAADEGMKPVGTPYFFYVLSAIAVLSGIAVITRKNPVHSALALIVTLLSLAGLYLMLYAPFVAGVQIIVYAGGIMVLFLFVIMLVNLERNLKEDQFSKQWPIAGLASAALFALIGFVVWKGNAVFPKNTVVLTENNNTQLIGIGLYQNYLLPFEIASLLLLVAIVGAVVMAKKNT